MIDKKYEKLVNKMIDLEIKKLSYQFPPFTFSTIQKSIFKYGFHAGCVFTRQQLPIDLEKLKKMIKNEKTKI